MYMYFLAHCCLIANCLPRQCPLTLLKNNVVTLPIGFFVSALGRSSTDHRRSIDHRRSVDGKQPVSPVASKVAPDGADPDSKEPKLPEEDVKVSLRELLKWQRPELKFLALGCLTAGCVGCITPAFSFLFASLITVFYLPTPVRKSQA